MHRIGTRLALTCSLVLLSACSERVSFLAPKFQMGPNNAQSLVVTPDGEVRESGRLTVSIRGFLDGLSKKRRLLATLADVDRVVVEVSASGLSFSQTLDSTALSSGTTTATFTGIPEGAATVTMKAYNASSQMIGQASKATTVTAGATTTVEIQLQLDPTYATPPSGGGSTNTGSITANGTIIDGMTAETYQLPAPGTDLVVAANGDAWLGVVSETPKTVVQVTPAGVLTEHEHSHPPTRLAIDSTSALWSSNVAAGMYGESEFIKFSTTPTWGRQAAIPPFGFVSNEWEVALTVDLDDHLIYSFFGALHKYDASAAKVFEQPIDLSWTNAVDTDSTHAIWAGGTVALDPGATQPPYRHVETISKYGPSGALLHTLPLLTEAESLEDDGTSGGPQVLELAVDHSDNVWVSLSRKNVVIKVSPDGTALGTFAVGMQPDGVAIDADGHVWVANTGEDTVTKLAPDGAVLGTFNVGSQPTHIAAGSSGVWVLNSGDNTITRFH